MIDDEDVGPPTGELDQDTATPDSLAGEADDVVEIEALDPIDAPTPRQRAVVVGLLIGASLGLLVVAAVSSWLAP